MKKYIGLKVVKAEPMTMTEAQKVLGRELKPATVEEDGFLVEYKDGYKSWSPASVFNEAYHRFGKMFFGEAVEALKSGLAVRREGWNGKGLFVVKQIPSHITFHLCSHYRSIVTNIVFAVARHSYHKYQKDTYFQNSRNHLTGRQKD